MTFSSSSTGSKRGRKAEHYRTSDDEVINGLARRPSDGRWRIIGTDITFTEPDEKLAIHRFRVWQAQKKAQQKQETLSIPLASAQIDDVDAVRRAIEFMDPEPRPINLPPFVGAYWTPPGTPPSAERTQSLLGTSIAKMNGDRIEFFRGGSMQADTLWAWLRNLILDKPQLVAEKTGIEQIGYLSELRKPTPSPTLDEVGKLYQDKAEISEHERRKSKLYWAEFVEAVGVKTVRELTPELAAGWMDKLNVTDLSPKSRKHRYGKIRSILHFARGRGMAPDDIRHAMDACAVLKAPRSLSLDPHPISRDDFHALLDKADDMGKAILLLSLNAALYPSEVADVTWKDLDLVNGTLIMDRGKTGVARVAVLWPRTIEAMQKLLPARGDSPFITRYGDGMAPNTATKIYRRLRKAAGISDNVKFADVRDGSYTAAASAQGVPFEQARMLAGHRCGMADHYLKRRPQIVADACTAVEKVYFG